jgi:hypothetical protein
MPAVRLASSQFTNLRLYHSLFCPLPRESAEEQTIRGADEQREQTSRQACQLSVVPVALSLLTLAEGKQEEGVDGVEGTVHAALQAVCDEPKGLRG